MMERQEHFSVPAVGGSALLVIFSVLCLTVFALLSLETVQADQRLADASLQAVSDYYEADREAERIFSRLRAGEFPEQVYWEGDLYMYACRISQHQELMVVLQHSGGDWKVLRWQADAAIEEQLEEIPDIWDGNTILWEAQYD